MESYYVLNWDFNSKELKHYDVMPYFIDEYKSKKERPQTFDEFKEFVKQWGHYMFWSRCQYEIVISQWPPEKNPLEHAKKVDIWQQIEMNLDIVTKILMNNVL